MNKLILSKWALIPSIMLLIVSYVFAGLAALNADDFQREMTVLESIVYLIPVIPIAWIVLIAISQAFGNINKNIIFERVGIVIIICVLLSVIATLLLIMQ